LLSSCQCSGAKSSSPCFSKPLASFLNLQQQKNHTQNKIKKIKSSQSSSSRQNPAFPLLSTTMREWGKIVTYENTRTFLKPGVKEGFDVRKTSRSLRGDHHITKRQEPDWDKPAKLKRKRQTKVMAKERRAKKARSSVYPPTNIHPGLLPLGSVLPESRQLQPNRKKNWVKKVKEKILTRGGGLRGFYFFYFVLSMILLIYLLLRI
jgi:hypothetical protein